MVQNEMVLVASVSILQDNRVLMIKENKPYAVNKWNFPSGVIEFGEDILAAAQREVKEETGLKVKLTSTTGVYNFFSSMGSQVVFFHFIGEVTGGSLSLEEEEITESTWLDLSELSSIPSQDLREPHVMEQIIGNIVQGNFHPLHVFQEQLK